MKIESFMKIDIAICQFDMKWEEISLNLDRVESLIAGVNADIIVLPEMFATGFKLSPDVVAEPMDGLVVTTMRRWARERCAAIVGSVVVCDDQGQYCNREIFMKPSGEMEYYDKRHPFSPGGESREYLRGDRRVVVEYKGFRFLLLICYDLRFPVWSRNMGDYDAIIYSASWAERRRRAWTTLLRARAIENQCYVVGVNRVGEDPTARYVGDSAVIDFLGEAMVDAEDTECVLTTTLDSEKLSKFKDSFPAWQDADRFNIDL